MVKKSMSEKEFFLTNSEKTMISVALDKERKYLLNWLRHCQEPNSKRYFGGLLQDLNSANAKIAEMLKPDLGGKHHYSKRKSKF